LRLTQPPLQRKDKGSIFSRNSSSHFAQYTSERPELSSHGEKSKKAKQQTKGKLKMRKLSITFATILMMLGCFAFSPAAKADQAIVGLWHNHFVSDFIPPFETYAQWHRDGLEIETPNFTPGVCMGTWTQTGARTFKLFHVGWLPGGGQNGSVRFELRELNTVSVDGNSFNGPYDQKFFDANGNLVAEDKGVIHSKRLSVDQF
jgi:hypothetical protein